MKTKWKNVNQYFTLKMQGYMKTILALVIIGFAFLVTGCIGGPSDAEIRAALEQGFRTELKEHAARAGQKLADPETISVQELKSESVTKTDNGEYTVKIAFTALIDGNTKNANALVTMNKARDEWRILTFEDLSNPLTYEDPIQKRKEAMDAQGAAIVMFLLTPWTLLLVFRKAMHRELFRALFLLTPVGTMIIGMVMAGFGYEISQFLADFGISTHFGFSSTGKIIMGLSTIGLVIAAFFGQVFQKQDARA